MSDDVFELFDDAGLRGKVWEIINRTQGNQLFVHSSQLDVQYSSQDGKKKVITRPVPEILVICVLNVLVPNSSMLLVGGHGGAKTTLAKLLGRMFTGSSLQDIEDGILRGHPQLTEEKILATLDLPTLMKGEEKVKWRSFVTDFWKIIDEVNRMTPYSQNILLSLLAERRVKFYDKSEPVHEFCLFATMNPQDEGTFELPLPFLDRFGISLPFSMPTTNDLSLILKSTDDRLFGYDELQRVPKTLLKENVIQIWTYVDKYKIEDEAEEYIEAIVREFSVCDRINKGVSNDKEIGPDLCNGCHFDTSRSICNKVTTILSVRAAKDLQRYAKALAWLIGIPADLFVVQTIAPYVIQHRVHYVSTEVNQAPFFGDGLRFTRHLLEMVKSRYLQRKELVDIMKQIKAGDAPADALKTLEEFAKNDLIIKNDFVPAAKIYSDPKYTSYLKRIEQAYDQSDDDALLLLKSELFNDTEMLNKGELLTKIGIYLKRISFKSYTFKFHVWRVVCAELQTYFPELIAELDKSLATSYQHPLGTKSSDIHLIVTGTEDSSDVHFDVSGGEDAKHIKDILLRAGVFTKDDLKITKRNK